MADKSEKMFCLADYEKEMQIQPEDHYSPLIWIIFS